MRNKEMIHQAGFLKKMICDQDKKRSGISVIVLLGILCVLFTGCTWNFLKTSTVPEANGLTEGWLYYVAEKGLYRMKEDCTESELIYEATMQDTGDYSLIVTEDKLYFLGQKLFSMNADGSGLYEYMPRYYSRYVPRYLLLNGDYLYAVETNSGQFGNGDACLVKIPIQGGSETKISGVGDYSNFTFSVSGDVLYLLGQTVLSYGSDSVNDTEYELTLQAYALSKNTASSEQTLTGISSFGKASASSDGSILFICDGDEIAAGENDTVWYLSCESGQVIAQEEIPGHVTKMQGDFCVFMGDFNASNGTFENEYVRNLVTGKDICIPANAAILGLTEQGIIVKRNVNGTTNQVNLITFN